MHSRRERDLTGQGGWEDTFFGDMANVTVPCTMYGNCDPRCQRTTGPGGPPKPQPQPCHGSPWFARNGTNGLAKLWPDNVAIRIYGCDDLMQDRTHMLPPPNKTARVKVDPDRLPLLNASACEAFCGTPSNPLGGVKNVCKFRRRLRKIT